MQGIKIYQEKLFNSFRLSDHVPVTNFYRRLKDILQLDFLYKETAVCYGKSWQKSIDPTMFFKLNLIGYLENIISDRKLISHCNMRLDLLSFLDYRTQTKKKEYRGSSHLCKTCPINSQCLGKTAKEKKFSVTYYREEYERNNKRIHSKQGRYMKRKRRSTVEPVFGTLTHFMKLRK